MTSNGKSTAGTPPRRQYKVAVSLTSKPGEPRAAFLKECTVLAWSPRHAVQLVRSAHPGHFCFDARPVEGE